MIEKEPDFMKDETLFDYTEEGIVLTEKGLKDPKTVSEYIEFIKMLAENK